MQIKLPANYDGRYFAESESSSEARLAFARITTADRICTSTLRSEGRPYSAGVSGVRVSAGSSRASSAAGRARRETRVAAARRRARRAARRPTRAPRVVPSPETACTDAPPGLSMNVPARSHTPENTYNT